MFEKLPFLDEKYCPQVLFLGPWDEWMKKAGKYKYLYEMDTNIAYNWLWVWVDANHPSFQNCIIDTSDSIHDGLNLITKKIIEKAIITSDPDIIGISLVWMPRMKRIQKECATLIMRLHLHTQFTPLYYQNHLSLMQTLFQQSWPC
jgi:hypothetical protein